MDHKKEWVSASDIGRACYCPQALSHKYQGTQVSKAAIASRQRGDEAHDALNRAAEDKRCFVASHLWGIDDPRTASLRHFRDKRLMPHAPGRCLVSAYYRLSPSLVDMARRFTLIDAILRWAVTGIVRRVQRKDQESAS